MHALGLEHDTAFIEILHHCPAHIHASTKFIQFLYDKGCLVESTSQDSGDLIAYLNNDEFKHIGVVLDGGRIRSKWGVGLLYEHAPLETPVSYGSTIRFFKPLERGVILDAFYEFATS